MAIRNTCLFRNFTSFSFSKKSDTEAATKHRHRRRKRGKLSEMYAKLKLKEFVG